MPVDNQLSDEIGGFLLETLGAVEREFHETANLDEPGDNVASNSSAVAGSAATESSSWQETAIFFVKGAKNYAKFAWNLPNRTKFRAADRRLRSALAACFFDQFCSFPLLMHGDKTGTTPQIHMAVSCFRAPHPLQDFKQGA